jgi:hypothetical protein
MKFLSSWILRPDTVPEAARRFLAGGGAPPAGVTLLGRWHRADASGGFSLFETNDPAALYAHAAEWAQFLDIQTVPVIEDADAAPVLAKLYGQ